MAVTLRRAGGFVDYFVEGTSEDMTAATVSDLAAALPMADLQIEPAFAPPPVPTYEHRPRLRRNVIALALSFVGGAMLLDAVVRLVVGR